MTVAGIIGPGRAGVGIALTLARAGLRVFIHGRSRRNLPAELEATWGAGVPPWLEQVEVILVAVQDDAVTGVAQALATSGCITRAQTILHMSGVLNQSALAPLSATGAALGSFHPLQTFTDPESAPGRLQGAVASVEGDERAMAAGERLAKAMGMKAVRLTGEAKARYHAGAVFASNYVVAVAEVARQILGDAGVPGDAAWKGLQGLLRGTFESLEAGSPAEALTGPISRGDAATVRMHLTLLKGEQAKLYRALGNVALELADLDEPARSEVKRALTE